MLLKMWLDPGAPPQLAGLHIPPIGSQLVHSLSIVYPLKAHMSWLRNSFSWHAVADICCLRQQNVIFHYFHNLPLSQKLDPRLYGLSHEKLLINQEKFLYCNFLRLCFLILCCRPNPLMLKTSILVYNLRIDLLNNE